MFPFSRFWIKNTIQTLSWTAFSFLILWSSQIVIVLVKCMISLNFLFCLTSRLSIASTKWNLYIDKIEAYFVWQLKQDTEEFRVMYREGPHGTPFHSLLVEGYVEAPLDVCKFAENNLTILKLLLLRKNWQITLLDITYDYNWQVLSLLKDMSKFNTLLQVYVCLGNLHCTQNGENCCSDCVIYQNMEEVCG